MRKSGELLLGDLVVEGGFERHNNRHKFTQALIRHSNSSSFKNALICIEYILYRDGVLHKASDPGHNKG